MRVASIGSGETCDGIVTNSRNWLGVVSCIQSIVAEGSAYLEWRWAVVVVDVVRSNFVGRGEVEILEL